MSGPDINKQDDERLQRHYSAACHVWLCEGLHAEDASMFFIVHVKCSGMSTVVIKCIIIIYYYDLLLLTAL